MVLGQEEPCDKRETKKEGEKNTEAKKAAEAADTKSKDDDLPGKKDMEKKEEVEAAKTDKKEAIPKHQTEKIEYEYERLKKMKLRKLRRKKPRRRSQSHQGKTDKIEATDSRQRQMKKRRLKKRRQRAGQRRMRRTREGWKSRRKETEKKEQDLPPAKTGDKIEASSTDGTETTTHEPLMPIKRPVAAHEQPRAAKNKKKAKEGEEDPDGEDADDEEDSQTAKTRGRPKAKAKAKSRGRKKHGAEDAEKGDGAEHMDRNREKPKEARMIQSQRG